ncbi:MAG: rhodanese-like domain-containing protein [Cytophagales bacterium]|nr:MAG: rhodanese-like domain-containing protein [Cytophagales bacterium]
MSVEEFATVFNQNKNLKVIDVRRKSEYNSEHVVGVENFPLDFIHENIHQLNPDKTYYLHCAGGYRSMIAASILKSKGFEHLVEVAGGFKAIKATNAFALTEYVCPTTLL